MQFVFELREPTCFLYNHFVMLFKHVLKMEIFMIIIKAFVTYLVFSLLKNRTVSLLKKWEQSYDTKKVIGII